MEDLKHTTAAEMEEFLTLTPTQQLLRIWMAQQETNGSVAEAFRQIDELRGGRPSWWVPVLLSTPAAILSIVTLVLLFAR